jgi:hypothetical protein
VSRMGRTPFHASERASSLPGRINSERGEAMVAISPNGCVLRGARITSRLRLAAAVVASAVLCGWSPAAVNTPYVVFGYNDLGMHCMNADFSEMMILPPFNTLHAQVIQRGAEPSIITADVTVRYIIPGNTRAADKFNFWAHSYPTLGGAPAPDAGVAGATACGRDDAHRGERLVYPGNPGSANG